MKVIEFDCDILADLLISEKSAVGTQIGYRYFVVFLTDEAVFST